MTQASDELRHEGESAPRFAAGWYRVADASVFRSARPVALRWMGEDVVAFRGPADEAGSSLRLMQGHCPHLGAHLGVGGRVVDGRLVCPFHGWEFDARSGSLEAVPYSTKATPKVCLRRWSARQVGASVFGWWGASTSLVAELRMPWSQGEAWYSSGAPTEVYAHHGGDWTRAFERGGVEFERLGPGYGCVRVPGQGSTSTDAPLWLVTASPAGDALGRDAIHLRFEYFAARRRDASGASLRERRSGAPLRAWLERAGFERHSESGSRRRALLPLWFPASEGAR